MRRVAIVDVGRATRHTCSRIASTLGWECVQIALRRTSCKSAAEMRRGFLRVRRSYDPRLQFATACVTCASVVPDIPNSVEAVCRRLEPYERIVVLSTRITSRVRPHERVHGRYIRYVAMDDVVDGIERDGRFPRARILKHLSRIGDEVTQADCIVLGCSHFCIHTRSITNELRTVGFEGDVIDSVEVFVRSLPAALA